MTEHTVAEAVRAAGLPGPTRFVEVTGSTNADVLELADSGAPEWTLEVAGHQDAGRGRLGRSWASSPGLSLLVSVLVRPALPPSDASLITLAAGACMAFACLAACGVAARCKWPNDLVVGERKLGGILVESKVRGDRLEYAVIGVGVNLKQRTTDFPAELRDTATSVTVEGGRPDGLALLHEFLVRMKQFCDPMDPAFPETVLASYRQVCMTLGRRVRATTASGRNIEGRAVEVGDHGQLVLETSSGREIVAFGEIAHLA